MSSTRALFLLFLMFEPDPVETVSGWVNSGCGSVIAISV